MKFKYTKSAEEVKIFLSILSILLCLEIPIHVGLWFLRFPWNAVSSLGILGFEGFLIVRVTSFLFTAHLLTDESLDIHCGVFARTSIPLSSIRSCELYRGQMPDADISTPRVLLSDNTLFLVLSRRRMVKLVVDELQPITLGRKNLVSTQFVFSVDEPEKLVRKLNNRCINLVTRDSDTKEKTNPFVRPFQGRESRSQSLSPILELRNVSKTFGSFQSVKNVTFSLYPGEVLGLVGRNGAGKTTLMNMISGESQPTSGVIEIFEKKIGFVPDQSVLFEDLSGRELLYYVTALCSVPKAERSAIVEYQLKTCGLDPFADRLVRSYSLGMRRRLSIAASLIQRPDILVLDEVTNGLDPIANAQVKEQIQLLANKGCSIILSSHILELISDLAHRVAIIENGEILYIGELPNTSPGTLVKNSLEGFYMDVIEKERSVRS